MRLLEALRNSVQRLESEIADSRLFDHKGDRGEFRERIIESFLRPYLPTCYGLSSGAAFSTDGASSRQLDVVIYDEIFSNVLFRDKENCLFPCESVYGAIEVKSSMSSADLEGAVANIASLKSLARSPSHMLDILPHRRINTGEGLTFDPEPRNPYLGAVFAYDGLAMDTVVSTLNDMHNSDQSRSNLLPDFLFNYRRGYFVLRMTIVGQTLQPVPLGRASAGFMAVATGTDTLPLLFLTINLCLNNLYLKAPDMDGYWKAVFDECLKEGPQICC